MAQIGHSAGVTSLAVSVDGRLVVSGSSDNSVKLWQASTGRLIRTFVGHAPTYTERWLYMAGYRDPRTGEKITDDSFNDHQGDSKIAAVAISPDARRIVSGSWDGTAKIWDTATGELLRTIEARSAEGYARSVYSVAFTNDGSGVLVGSSDQAVKLFDAATGRRLLTFDGHKRVDTIAVSRDGRFVLTGGQDNVIQLWDASSARLVRRFDGHTDHIVALGFLADPNAFASTSRDGKLKVWSVQSGAATRTIDLPSKSHVSAISPDGRKAVAAKHGEVNVWDLATGALERTLKIDGGAQALGLSRDASTLLLGADAGSTGTSGPLELRDAVTGTVQAVMKGRTAGVRTVGFSRDGNTLLMGAPYSLWDARSGRLVRRLEALADHGIFSPDGNTILTESSIWATATGALTKELKTDAPASVGVFSPDGKVVALAGYQGVELREVASGRLIRKLASAIPKIDALAFSPDGKRLAVAGQAVQPPVAAELWDIGSGRRLQQLIGHSHWIKGITFSPDGARVATSSLDNSGIVWEAASGRRLFSLSGHSGSVNWVGYSRDGRHLFTASDDRTIRKWDAATGREERTLAGHLDRVTAADLSADGRRLLSGSADGTMRLWDLATGQVVLVLAGASQESWIGMTAAGFFGGTAEGQQLLHIVRGVDVTSIDQVHQSLFNPDLVREAAANDPDGEVAAAVKVIDLGKVLDSGPAPEVTVSSPSSGGQLTTETVRVTARIADKGKGIGRIEWRVNGLTAAVMPRPRDRGPVVTVTQDVILEPGNNTIEVVAYNGSTALASAPARVTVRFVGAAGTDRPKLHVLAIGIDKYVDKGWMPPGASEPLLFPPLALAVKDAKAVTEELKKLGGAFYADVKVTLALDHDAARDNLEKIVERAAKDVHPRDTFVLFAAAHGFSHRGRFYLIPQDYTGGTDPAALESRAVGQDRLQAWLANHVRAKRAVVLLDTCEAGALVAGHLRSRTDGITSEAGIGRLHEATGRPVLTAAAVGQFAHEGAVGSTGATHGIFTWALLDALRNGDRNGNKLIELSEIVAHVQAQVPALAARLKGDNRAAGIAATPEFGKQSARFGSRGEDFVLASLGTPLPTRQLDSTAAVDPRTAGSLVIELKSGRVKVKLRPDLAPMHVDRVKQLALERFYDGLAFHRVIAGFMAQTGDPTGTGTGGSRYGRLQAEFSKEPFKRGTIGAARAMEPDSANSQFFICFTDTSCANLNGQYTIWGEVVEGMEFVDKIKSSTAPTGQVSEPDRMVNVYLSK